MYHCLAMENKSFKKLKNPDYYANIATPKFSEQTEHQQKVKKYTQRSLDKCTKYKTTTSGQKENQNAYHNLKLRPPLTIEIPNKQSHEEISR